MTTTEDHQRTGTARRGAGRFAGIAFAVLYVGGFAFWLTGPSIYEDGSASAYAAAYADGSRIDVLAPAAFFLWPLACAALVWAVAHMAGHVDRQRREHTVAGRVALAGAAVMAAGHTLAAAANFAAAHIATGDAPRFPRDPDAAYALDILSSQVQNISMWGGAVAMATLGVVAARAGLLPGWFAWTGVVVAPLLTASFIFLTLPTLVFLVWVATAPVIMRARPIADA